MAVPLCMKRMLHEKITLTKSNPDYFVSIHDSDILHFTAYVLGPVDSLYAHKLVKLRFEIPQSYPLQPPNCKFVQHSAHRVHPNLYVEGKVCLSILGPWPGEPWATAMTVESVLITISSLLDSSPYSRKPGQKDNPLFNACVKYESWRCLLLDYIVHETDPAAKVFLASHLRTHGDAMLGELQKQQTENARATGWVNPYARKHKVVPVYPALLASLHGQIMLARQQPMVETAPEAVRVSTEPSSLMQPTSGVVRQTKRIMDMFGTSKPRAMSPNSTNLKSSLARTEKSSDLNSPDPRGSMNNSLGKRSADLDMADMPLKHRKLKPAVVDLI